MIVEIIECILVGAAHGLASGVSRRSVAARNVVRMAYPYAHIDRDGIVHTWDKREREWPAYRGTKLPGLNAAEDAAMPALRDGDIPPPHMRGGC